MSIQSKSALLLLVYYGNVLLQLVIAVYHKCVVLAIKIVRKGGAKLYEKFVVLLVKHNKTAYRVSKDTGIAQSVLSDWKTGRSKPKADKLKILADYFGVPIEYFLEE